MAKRGGVKHGGKRQGTPGKSYLNRTDLSHDYSPQSAANTAAAGAFGATMGGAPSAPARSGPTPQMWTTPDEVPSLTDPTALPNEDPTRGLNESLPMPAPDWLNRLNAAYMAYPTPELRRALNLLAAKGQY